MTTFAFVDTWAPGDPLRFSTGVFACRHLFEIFDDTHPDEPDEYDDEFYLSSVICWGSKAMRWDPDDLNIMGPWRWLRGAA